MKNIVAVLFSFVFVNLFSQDTEQKIDADLLKKDISILHAALTEAHPGFYRYRSKQEMDALFDSLTGAINHPMTAAEFTLLVSRATAFICDGHTRTVAPKIFQDKIDAGRTAIPFKPFFSGSGIYISMNFSQLPDSVFLGAEILSVNGVSSKKIREDALAMLSSDAGIVSRKFRLLESVRWFTRYFNYLYGYSEKYIVRYLPMKTSVIREDTLAGLEFDEMLNILAKRYPSKNNLPPGAFSSEKKTSTAILRISDFGKTTWSKEKISFGTFITDAFSKMKTDSIRNLILDLRGNPGGYDEHGKLLYSFFAPSDFMYYDSLYFLKRKFDFFQYTNHKRKKVPRKMVKRNSKGYYDMVSHANWGKQKKAAYSFTGNIYVLINGACFSTTSEFLTLMKVNTNAVFIGEESGGAMEGNCSGATPDIILPASGVRVEIPLMKYVMAANGKKLPRTGIIPDFPVNQTIEDKLSGNDPALNKAIELIQEKKKQQ